MITIKPIEFIRKELNNNILFENCYMLFEKINKAYKNRKNYNIGDDVILPKGTLLHGIKSYNIEKLEGIKEHGIIFSEYRGVEVKQQKYCVCFWIMNEKTKLKDYVNYYSAETIHIQNRITRKYKQIYIPYSFDVKDRQEMFKNINNLLYRIDFVRDSKENQFLPSLNKVDDYIGLIISNNYIEEIKKIDIYSGNLTIEDLSFLPEWVIQRTIIKKLPTQTDHEIAIPFGLPSNLIEGIIVGKMVETNENDLKAIKKIFPNCYICNLYGKVIK